MSQAEVIRTLKVKTGALKRVQKELSMYEKERDKEQARVEKLRADNAEPHDLKQAVRGGGGMIVRQIKQDAGRSVLPSVLQEHSGREHGTRKAQEVGPRSEGGGELSRTRSTLHAQENVLNEAAMMVPETQQRLEATYSDLQSFLVSQEAPRLVLVLAALARAGASAALWHGRWLRRPTMAQTSQLRLKSWQLPRRSWRWSTASRRRSG